MNKKVITKTTGALVWLTLCAIPPPALADEMQGKSWSDEAELSFVSTGGNSDVETLSAKNLYKLKFAESYTFIWKLEALNSKTDDTLSAKRYFTDLRLEYAFSERTYSYTSTGWLRDTFAGLDSRVNFSVGGGYRFLDGPESFFKLEAGVNNVKESYTTEEPDRRFTEGRLYGEYIYHFTEKNKFSQSIESLHDFSDSDRYRLNSETALTAALNNRFSLKISYQIKYNHQPVPATLDKSDTILSTAIVANF